jgi:inner membrane transporter RhtA
VKAGANAPPERGAFGPAIGLVLSAILSVQLGSAAATTLFDDLGPTGTVLYRLLFAALVLMVFWRPTVRGLSGESWRLVVAFGFALAAMNLCFYLSLDRIPLGIAVTFEFVGPLGVALIGSHRRIDLLWVALAAAGVVLLAGPAGDPDPIGVAFALAAGFFWGSYILLSARVGRALPGGSGLALAMVVSAALLVVPGVIDAGGDLLDLRAVAIGAAVALLSSVIPYSFELEALRRLSTGVFGVLMSLEPAVAALVGLIALSQGLAFAEAVGIGLVTAASAGALRRGAEAPTEA